MKKTLAALVLALPAGGYRVEWVSPMTGEVVASQDLRHAGGDCELQPPRFMVDLAFRLRQQ